MYAIVTIISIVTAVTALPASSTPKECMEDMKKKYAQHLALLPEDQDHTAIMQKVMEQIDVSKCKNINFRIDMDDSEKHVPSNQNISKKRISKRHLHNDSADVEVNVRLTEKNYNYDQYDRNAGEAQSSSNERQTGTYNRRIIENRDFVPRYGTQRRPNVNYYPTQQSDDSQDEPNDQYHQSSRPEYNYDESNVDYYDDMQPYVPYDKTNLGYRSVKQKNIAKGPTNKYVDQDDMNKNASLENMTTLHEITTETSFSSTKNIYRETRKPYTDSNYDTTKDSLDYTAELTTKDQNEDINYASNTFESSTPYFVTKSLPESELTSSTISELTSPTISELTSTTISELTSTTISSKQSKNTEKVQTEIAPVQDFEKNDIPDDLRLQQIGSNELQQNNKLVENNPYQIQSFIPDFSSLFWFISDAYKNLNTNKLKQIFSDPSVNALLTSFINVFKCISGSVCNFFKQILSIFTAGE